MGFSVMQLIKGDRHLFVIITGKMCLSPFIFHVECPPQLRYNETHENKEADHIYPAVTLDVRDYRILLS